MLNKVIGVAVFFAISTVCNPEGYATTYSGSFSVNGMPYSVVRNETVAGNVRKINLTGTYSVPTGETLQRVDVYWLYPGAGGQAQGTVSSTSWNAAVGDFQLKQYYLRFTIRRGGKNFSYSSPIYSFGVQ